MKNRHVCMITAAIVLSLTACGSQTSSTASESVSMEVSTTKTEAEPTISKDDMMKNAQDFNANKFNTDLESNKVRAQEIYCGNTYECSGNIDEIAEDYAIMSMGSVELKVNLSKEDLMLLNTDEMVTIVGSITDVTYEKIEKHIADIVYKSNVSSAIVNPAYYVSDTVVLTGKIKMDGFFHYEMPNYSGAFVLEESEIISFDKEEGVIIISGQEILIDSNVTISGKTNKSMLKDVKLISVN